MNLSQVSVGVFCFVHKGCLGPAVFNTCYCLWDPFCTLEHLKRCCR